MTVDDGARTALEAAMLAEELLSEARHDAYNHFAAARNAVAYLRKKLTGTDPWRADARIGQFLDLIEVEIDAATHVLRSAKARAELHVSQPTAVRLVACVAAALDRLAPSETAHVSVRAETDPTVWADGLEVALMIACLLREIRPGVDGVVVRIVQEEGHVLLEVSGGAADADSKYRRIARRLADRARATLTAVDASRVRVSFPPVSSR